MRDFSAGKINATHRGRNHQTGLSMRIAMIGAGYVGLVSGACFSDFGHHVSCIDSDEEKVTALNSGEIPVL